MVNGTIFDTVSLDRDLVKWEDYLEKLTPVHQVQTEEFSIQVKRGDWFAPLGYGFINGDKLRTALWLINNHIKKGGKNEIVHGALLGSPQAPMVTSIARHYGFDTTTITASRPHTALNHEAVQIAALMGSKFSFVGSGYKSVLKKRCEELLADKECALYLECGTTLDHKNKRNKVEDMFEFHKISAHQVQNIPDDVEDLVIPFGGSNSSLGIFIGLCLYPKKNLKRVHLFGIGPNKLKWFMERLEMFKTHMGEQGKNLTAFSNNFERFGVIDQTKCDLFPTGDEVAPLFDVEYTDLSLYWSYNDLVRETLGDIELHPRYEGKVARYVKDSRKDLLKQSTLFWVVGSEPTLQGLYNNVPDIGEVPETITVID